MQPTDPHRAAAPDDNLADHAPVMVWVTAPDGRCTYLSRLWYELTGQTAATGLGFGWLDATHPDDRARAERTFLEANARREPFRLEYRLRRRDGAYRWAIDAAAPRFAGGEFLGFVGSVIDITERREAELALRQSEQRYRSLVSVLTDVPWTTDARGRFVTPQPAWQAYTGQSWEQHQGFGWADALHPDDRDHIQRCWRLACESGADYESRGRAWHAPSGGYRYFEARATPLRNDDGSVREWVGTCTDVHEARLAEEALRAADRRKDEFLATLAHELRNPLAPVRNSLHLLRLAGADAAAHSRLVDMMARQVDHMVRLVDDLLEVSRITRGKVELRKELVELASVVGNAAETAGPALEAAGLQLAINLPGEPVLLDADPVRLAQVLTNLLNNAAKYTEAGGQVWLTARAEAGEVALSVRDSGVGIPAEMLPRVFDLFTQIDRTLGRARGGLGIGLSLVKSLVEMHGGRVEARSDGPGRGSEFVVRLPRVAAAATPAEGGRRAVALGGRRVLVVDDNRDAADSLAMLLRFLGAEVATAYDGPAALEAIAAFAPAVVLLDLGMPGMDGYAVAAEVRREPRLREVMLVALTGWGQEEDKRRTREAGFDAHLVKPVDLEALPTILAPR